MTPQCGVNIPCTPDQLKAMANVGELVTNSVSSLVTDVGLPKYASQMGLSAISSLVGGIEGAVGKQLKDWAALNAPEFAIVQDIGMQVMYAMAGDASAGEKFASLAKTLTKVGTSVAIEVAKDAANVVPIVGAVIGVVIELVAALIDALQGPSAYETAVQADIERHANCVAMLRSNAVLPTGEGSTLPADIFNGAPSAPYNMPGVGLGLVAATEPNRLVPPKVAKALAGLRRAIQGSWLGQGVPGQDPMVGGVVPPTPGSSDGGATLWPLYMDTVLWQRTLGNLADDVLYTSLAQFTPCPSETLPSVIALIDDWRARKRSADTGTGYTQWKKTPLTATQKLALHVGSAHYAGGLAGIAYKPVALSDGGIALVGPGKSVVSFPKKFSTTASLGKGGPPALLVFSLAAATAYFGFRLAKRYG